MSASLAVEALTLTLGAFRLNQIDFALARGEILVILGPNGAGKSVTLETIAGFHRPDSGRVLIGGSEVTALPPERRNIGFVVQNFGLFPHLTVAQNVAIARRSDRAIAAPDSTFPAHGDPAALLSYFGVAHLAKRMPAALSPGEKQRVALARALASVPDVFLFDEPFSALDADMREQLREELNTFLRALAIPAILVTHDRGDAIALADKIMVLRDGAGVQSGAAAEVFRKPISSFVARFVGVENVLPGRIVETTENGISIEVGKQIVGAARGQSMPAGRPIVVSIHAEDVAVSLPEGERQKSAINRFAGRVTAMRRAGALVTIAIDCGFPLRAFLLGPQVREMGLDVGSGVAVQIAPEAVHIMAD